MRFFNNFTAIKSVGLILLIAGALITYNSEKIAIAIKKINLNLIIKIIGLAIVIASFIIIMTA